MKPESTVSLGHCYRDTVSGFVGVCTAITEYLHDGLSARLTAETGAATELIHESFPPGRLVVHLEKAAGFAVSET